MEIDYIKGSGNYKAYPGEEVFRDGDWAIQTDKMIFYYKNPETYIIEHKCDGYRFRPYSFVKCDHCGEYPTDGFKAVFKFLLQSNGEPVTNLGEGKER